MAKHETNKIGGDGLHLTWIKDPSFWKSSSCQLGADMLLLGDTTNLIALNAAVVEHTPQRPIRQTRREKTHKQSTVLLVNTGYGFITSEYFLADGITGNPRQGLEVNAAFQWTARHGMGAGLRYAGYFSKMYFDSEKLQLQLHYLAPSLFCAKASAAAGHSMNRQASEWLNTSNATSKSKRDIRVLAGTLITVLST